MTNNLDKSSSKILVLGDSGVGKSSLIHLICHSSVFSSAQWTIGCSIDVKLFQNSYLEFWDIGGSRSHKIARSFLYQDYHGIMLVFDATNNKSRLNLNEWLTEVTQKSPNLNVPAITIATKKDLISHGSALDISSESYLLNQVIYVNTQDVLSFIPGSRNYDMLNNYFLQVIDGRNKRFYTKPFVAAGHL